jgi:hypothetical protein
MKDILANTDWILIIKIFFATLGLGIGLFLGKYLKSFIIWIKCGIENGDGVLQNKELQIMWFSFLFAFMVVGTTFFDKTYPIEMILGALAGAGIMYGVNEWSKTKNGKPQKPVETPHEAPKTEEDES